MLVLVWVCAREMSMLETSSETPLNDEAAKKLNDINSAQHPSKHSNMNINLVFCALLCRNRFASSTLEIFIPFLKLLPKGQIEKMLWTHSEIVRSKALVEAMPKALGLRDFHETVENVFV